VELRTGWRDYIDKQVASGHWKIERANRAEWAGQRIEDGVLRFGRNSTNYRLDTNLTGIKSELREFVILDGCDDLTEIDIRASQPYLLTGLMRFASRFCDEPAASVTAIQEWSDFRTAPTDPYVALATCLFGESNTDIRATGKKAAFTVVFSKNAHKQHGKQEFGERFPEVDAFIRRLKNKKKEHGACAIFLQQYEAAIMIERVGSRLTAAGIPAFTVHDSLIIKTCDARRTEEIMSDELTRTVRTRPVLRRKRFGRFDHKTTSSNAS
jgi:hypothetical protein